MREQIADLEYWFENTYLESNIHTRAQLMREYLDGKKGTWDLHNNIEAEVKFDKMMVSGGPGQEDFAETPEDALYSGNGAQE